MAEHPAPWGYPRTAAMLLVAEALLVVSPVLAVSLYFTGAGVIGKAAAYVRVADVAAQGVAYLLTPLLVLLLLLAAWGVWHGTRGIAALLLQLPVVAAGPLPFLQPFSPASAVGWGRWLLVGVVIATTVVLVLHLWQYLRDTDAAAPLRPARRWWWPAAFTAGVLVIAAVGATSRTLAYDPTARLLTQLEGAAPAPAGPLRHLPTSAVPAQNPELAPDPWNGIHNDSWATDSYTIPAPADPGGAAVQSLFTGGDCATITFDSRGRLVTLCATLTRMIGYVIDPANLAVLAQQVIGTRSPGLTDFSGGGYFVLDRQDNIVTPTSAGRILVIDTGGDTPRLAQEASYDVAGTLQPDERLTSVLPDWRGRYWYVGSKGTVGVVNRATGAAAVISLAGESIENSFAVTQTAVYVVTGAALYRMWTDAAGRPAVVWRTPYDAGTRQKAGQTSRASGTTPTVFAGGRFVAITDNGDPRMQVVVADTATGRIRCTQPVFAADRSATENSLVAAGSTLVVANNDGYAPAITATAGGHITTPGLAAVAVSRRGDCTTRWENDTVSAPSVVSKATLAGNLILTYTKPGSALGADGWYFTAVDLRSGSLVWRRLAGAGIPYNNHYAGAYLGPAGDMFVGTVNGIAVLRGS